MIWLVLWTPPTEWENKKCSKPPTRLCCSWFIVANRCQQLLTLPNLYSPLISWDPPSGTQEARKRTAPVIGGSLVWSSAHAPGGFFDVRNLATLEPVEIAWSMRRISGTLWETYTNNYGKSPLIMGKLKVFSVAVFNLSFDISRG